MLNFTICMEESAIFVKLARMAGLGGEIDDGDGQRTDSGMRRCLTVTM